MGFIVIISREITTDLFLALLAAVGVLRVVEVWISKRHQRRLIARGASRIGSQRFGLMVSVHIAILLGAALEVLLLKRPFYMALAVPMFALFIVANLARLWVIRTLGEHWSVQVVNSTGLGIVTDGPFRYVRHPNYAAVFVEMAALPLIHTAWITAIAGTCAHIWALRKRLEDEEPVLLTDPEYRAAMASKPRFVPRIL